MVILKQFSASKLIFYKKVWMRFSNIDLLGVYLQCLKPGIKTIMKTPCRVNLINKEKKMDEF